MSKVKIYEIKSSAATSAPTLLSPDGKYFYWNDTYFQSNAIGDKVFFINPTSKWALYTEVKVLDIPAVYNAENNSATFNHEYNTYTVIDPDGRYTTFLRFDIIQKEIIPEIWRWTKYLGAPQEYYLWKEGIEIDPGRYEKLDDLEKIFTDGRAFEELENCRVALNKASMLSAIIDALKDKRIGEYIAAAEFLHQLASDKLEELIKFEPSNKEEFYQHLMDMFGEKEVSFIDFLNKFTTDSDEYKLLKLIGEVVAYCDLNAANKKEFNQYADKRVLALSFVRQTNWVENLLRYKASGSDVNSINSPSIRNAIGYLLSPDKELTMLAENHRKMVARYLLRTAYDKSSFVADLLRFFDPYVIRPANPLNLTKIICHILYRFEDVKKLWFEKVEGLVVCDNTGWLDNAINSLVGHANIVLWWDKLPSGGVATQKLLREQITDNGSFYIFYTKDKQAYCRARIVDFALEEDYPGRNWNINDDVAWHEKDFKEYSEEKEKGKIKKARIVFLADEIIKLKTPIGYDNFEFYNDHQPPTQNNMQPYAEIKAEVEAAVMDEVVTAEKQVRSIESTLNTIGFDHEHRKILMAIKTKPLVLLAGISGTGKSRLARTLAYKTCALKELQDENPKNFLLIQVKPNWHDSTELLGYASGITGRREYIITPFIQFLVKAWKYPEIPFIICLDEMNLAPVEQYFAEFLSAIESREYKNGRLLTDPLIAAAIFIKHNNAEFWKDLGVTEDKRLQDHFQKNGLGIAQNIAVIGTVNMDETTHSFSRKVLDRAMTIEMNEVNLREGLSDKNKDWDYPDLFYSPDQVIGVHTFGGEVNNLFDKSSDVISFLETINKVLEKTPFKIAYRVRDEALVYCYHNSKFATEDPGWLNKVLDEIVCMKILSRIEGDESKTKKVLDGLLEILVEKDFPISHAKLKEMVERLVYGYTSFWP